LATPHLPHGWDAGVLFEETERTLFCSDLLLQAGECAPLTTHSVVEPARQALIEGQAGPFVHALPYTGETDRLVETLAPLGPRTLAVNARLESCGRRRDGLAGILAGRARSAGAEAIRSLTIAERLKAPARSRRQPPYCG
jgi:hypothetical protein